MVDHIDGAKTVEVPGADYMPFGPDSVPLLDAVEEFLTGRLPQAPFDKCWPPCCSLTLSTRPGWPPAWVTDVGAHSLMITTPSCAEKSSGFVAPGSNRLATVRSRRLTARHVIRCACAIRDGVQPLGLEIRAGSIVGKSSCMVTTLLASQSTSASAWRRSRPRTRSLLPAPSSISSQAQRLTSPTEASTNSRESREPGECSRRTATNAITADRRTQIERRSGHSGRVRESSAVAVGAPRALSA